MTELKCSTTTEDNTSKKGLIISYVSIIIGIIGIILAVIFYYNSVKRQGPSYSVSGSNIIAQSATANPAVKVMYNNVSVPCVTVSYIEFWNAGSEVITNNDIAAADPLRISVKSGCRILSAEIVKASRKAMNPILMDNGYEVIAEFALLAVFPIFQAHFPCG